MWPVSPHEDISNGGQSFPSLLIRKLIPLYVSAQLQQKITTALLKVKLWKSRNVHGKGPNIGQCEEEAQSSTASHKHTVSFVQAPTESLTMTTCQGEDLGTVLVVKESWATSTIRQYICPHDDAIKQTTMASLLNLDTPTIISLTTGVRRGIELY